MRENRSCRRSAATPSTRLRRFRDLIGDRNRDVVVPSLLFPAALAAVKAGKDLDETRFYLCPFCGHIELGEAPDACPICGAKGSEFVQV